MTNHPDFSIPDRVISGRWLLPIMALLREPHRFGEIQTSLSGLSRGVLAAQLQELQSMALVSQKNYRCFPPQVDYALTEKGQALLKILLSLK